MQIAGVLKKPVLRVDPRTKFFLLVFVGIFAFAFPPMYFEVSVVTALSLLLALNGQLRSALKSFLLFFLLLTIDIWLAPILPNSIEPVLFATMRLARIFIPLWLVGLLLIRTTTVTEFIAAFRKMHLPDAFIIPFSVMFRFIPTVSEEWKSIRNAMRFRGIGASFKNVLTKPMKTLEYILIPLLMSTATIAGELAAASLARGLDSEGERSCIVNVSFGAADFVIVLVCVALMVCQVVGIG